jgi:hypothetical protein
MDPKEREELKTLRYRMTSLSNSGESLRLYINSCLQTSEPSQRWQSAAAAISELVSLMTAGLSVLQFDIERSLWTEDFTQLHNWKAHWHTALENCMTQNNLRYMDEDF